MPAFRSTTITAAALLALIVGCVGCDGHAKEKETDTADASQSTVSDGGGSDSGGDENSTETPDPSAIPQVDPPDPRDYPDMNQQTEQGAQQTLRYFWAALIYGYQTGDTQYIRSVQTDSCEYCNHAADSVEKLRKSGKYWGPTSIVDVSLRTDSQKGNDFVIFYAFNVSEHSEPSETGEKVEKEIGHGSAGLIVWDGTSWKVETIDLV